eukprot:TRINITY_DN77455_c0_g1_i1.p1 TRINITY_DN77455_c0_g1~~TRINITY_DN77455_c0_g1_i1.p1  ORF type:complete len:325 (-),score=42.50 TRINITY_DN77455_c0_g1_i1:193-1167(-)
MEGPVDDPLDSSSLQAMREALTRAAANSTLAHDQRMLEEMDDVSTRPRCPRPASQPCRRLPQADDVSSCRWTEPPSKEEVRVAVSKTAAANGHTLGDHFKTHLSSIGGEFQPCRFLRGQTLDVWAAARAVQPERTYRCPRNVPGYRFSGTSKPLPEPSVACTRMHQRWLRRHARTREREIHPQHYASVRLEEAKRLQAEHRGRRQVARDIATRVQRNPPEFSENVKKTLEKVKLAVKTSRSIRESADVKSSSLAQEEQEDQARVERAQSAPELALRPPIPKERVRHHNNWVGPDRAPRDFKTSVPLFELDEGTRIKSKRRQSCR